mmetsp:Transcript_11603/g.15724  ORF Transcript_11603/g.15724 Transcript_11603/m.15724 type:complete len:95 (-) Transcript_11603:185-469(-)
MVLIDEYKSLIDQVESGLENESLKDRLATELQEAGVEFRAIESEPIYSAKEGEARVKVLLLKTTGEKQSKKYYLAVLPTDRKFDLGKFSVMAKA